MLSTHFISSKYYQAIAFLRHCIYLCGVNKFRLWADVLHTFVSGARIRIRIAHLKLINAIDWCVSRSFACCFIFRLFFALRFSFVKCILATLCSFGCVKFYTDASGLHSKSASFFSNFFSFFGVFVYHGRLDAQQSLWAGACFFV